MLPIDNGWVEGNKELKISIHDIAWRNKRKEKNWIDPIQVVPGKKKRLKY
ncbi:MAG: hypothetical protein K9M57_07105 [Phycisphaerae bacterium]|nr:hypothetical protein [Phycisphaerae bacterium]